LHHVMTIVSIVSRPLSVERALDHFELMRSQPPANAGR